MPDGDFDASVHSVFDSAVNLRPDEGPGLLTLTGSSEADLPQGIRLNTPEGFSFRELQAGEQAVCRNHRLHFRNTSLIVALNGARRWKCDLPALEFDPSNRAVAAAWSLVWGRLNKRQRLCGAEIVGQEAVRPGESVHPGLPRRVGEALRDLLDATRRYDDRPGQAVTALIGLGSGLTPGGDDLLVGYLAGIWCTIRGRSERARFAASLGKRIIAVSDRTNDISRTYLYHAAQGQISSHLEGLARAMCHAEEPDRLFDLAEAAMQVGHTSGMDAVTGLLVGLMAWERGLSRIA